MNQVRQCGILRKLKRPGCAMLPRILKDMHVQQQDRQNQLMYSKGLLQMFGRNNDVNVEFLGNGGLGVVGDFTNDNLDLVIKTVMFPYNDNEIHMARNLCDRMNMLTNEAKMHQLAYKRCPDVTCRYIAFEVFGPVGFIVMEKLPGKTLNDIMYDENFDLDSNINLIAEGVAKCINQLHLAGILHLDFKIDNLMFTGNTVKAIDFGNAKTIETVSTECQRAAASGHQSVFYNQNHHFTGIQLYCTNPVRTPQFERLVMQAEKNSAILCLIDLHQRRIVTFNPDFEEHPIPSERTAQLIRIFGVTRCEELCFELRHNTKFIPGLHPNHLGFTAFCPTPGVMLHLTDHNVEIWLDNLLEVLEPAVRALVTTMARLIQ